MLRIDEVETPLGTVHLAARGEAICSMTFGPPDLRGPGGEEPRRERIAAADRVRAYFAGELRALDDLHVDPAGTGFQRAVWRLLREIPPGETRSYAWLAARLGSWPRAVGGANAANPVCLAVPCHRVIRSDGALCGYAFGVERKQWLLAHEQRFGRDGHLSG